jgi:hypothetical protein
MFLKPFFEEAIREKDLEMIAGDTSEGKGTEPGCKAMRNELALDVGNGRLPYVMGQAGLSWHALSLLRPCLNFA